MEGKPFLRVPEAYRGKLRDQMVNFISSQMSCEHQPSAMLCSRSKMAERCSKSARRWLHT